MYKVLVGFFSWHLAGKLPAGIQFLGRMFAEPTLVKLCYGFEHGTLHRNKLPPPTRPFYQDTQAVTSGKGQKKE
jgi:hypothetical protein